MMHRLILSIWAVFTLAMPVHAQSELEKGFSGALRGCEEWVLNPSSWVDGPGPFTSAVGLGDKMGLVDSVHEVQLPPPEWRLNNRYWRINSTEGAGYLLVVSDRLPMCHITGGGDTDLQPVVEAVLSTSDFANRWEQAGSSTHGEMISTTFQNRAEPAFWIVVSRAKEAGGRLDHVQVIVSARFETRQ